MNTEIELDLGTLLRRVRARWLVVVTPVVVLVGAQLYLASRTTPLYSSSTEVLLQAKSTDAILSGVSDSNSPDSFNSARVMNTEIRVVESQRVLSSVQSLLGFKVKVNATGDASSDVLRISASNASPERAAIIANTVASEYIAFRKDQSVKDLVEAQRQLQVKINGFQDQINDLNTNLAAQADGAGPEATAIRSERDGLLKQQQSYQERIDGLSVDATLKSGGASILTKAEPAKEPFSPKPLRSAAIGLVLGLLFGVGLALLLARLDDRIRSKNDLALVDESLPLLGLIPDSSPRGRRLLRKVLRTRERTPKMEIPAQSAEAYRSLRSSIQFIGLDKPIRVIQVTSCRSGEGKSTTAVNLARVIAGTGQRVMVIDGDLRNPRLHEYFGLANDHGFSDVLTGESGIAGVSRSIGDDDTLTVMPSGPIPPNPAELLAGQRASIVVDAIRAHYDTLIIDGPPVLPVTDPVIISQLVDATVLVTRADYSTKEELERTLETLQQANAPVIGFVLNAVQRNHRSRYGYGRYGYGYGYGYGPGAGASADKAKQAKRARKQVIVESEDVKPPEDSAIWTGHTSASNGQPVVPRNGRAAAPVSPLRPSPVKGTQTSDDDFWGDDSPSNNGSHAPTGTDGGNDTRPSSSKA